MGCLCRGSIVVAMIIALAAAELARAQEGEGDKADWTWIRAEAKAALVLEPPPLKGAASWTIESPRHRGPIICLSVSPDGTRAATGGSDAVVRIWNLETGRLEKALTGHRYHLYSMDWSSDGTSLATHAWGDSQLIVWDVATGGIKKRFERPLQMRSLRWSRDGRRLAGCTLGSGRITMVDGLGEPAMLKEMGQPLASIDWSPDGTKLAAVAFGNVASIVDAGSGAGSVSLDSESDETYSVVRFSPDGKAVATGNARTASIWDPATGKRVARIDTPVADLAWSPDGKRLATVSALGLKLWDGGDGKPAGGLPVSGGLIEWNAASGRIVVASAARLQVWMADAKEPAVSIDAGGSAAPIFQAGKPVLTGVGTPVLTAWDAVTFKRIGRLEGHAKAVTAAAWSQDGKRFASGDEDGMVRMWDVKGAKSLHECGGHKGRVMCLEWAPDGKTLASACADKTVRLWSADGNATGTLEGHDGPIDAVTWSPNGRQIATGGRDKRLIVWDAVKLTEARRIEGSLPILALAWAIVKGTPALACGFGDGSLQVVNPASGELLATLSSGRSTSWIRTTAVGWMPGNRPLLLAGRYYLAQIWDVGERKTVQRQLAPGGVSALFPTAGGGLVVTRSDDRTVRFWDPVSGTLRGVLLEEGDSLVGVSTGGDVKYDPATTPALIAIVDTDSGQQTMALDDLAKIHGWKNNAKVMKLPTRN